MQYTNAEVRCVSDLEVNSVLQSLQCNPNHTTNAMSNFATFKSQYVNSMCQRDTYHEWISA